MYAKEITVLMVEPGKHPRVTTLKDDLDSLQKAVSIGADYQGLIEFVGLGNGDCIMCNEEGKLIDIEGNRRLGYGILVGVFYIMSENEGGWCFFSHGKPHSGQTGRNRRSAKDPGRPTLGLQAMNCKFCNKIPSPSGRRGSRANRKIPRTSNPRRVS